MYGRFLFNINVELIQYIFIYLIQTETIGVNWLEIMVYISIKIAIIHDWSWSFVILLIDVNVWPPIKVELSISSSLNHITWRYINCNFQPFNASKRPQLQSTTSSIHQHFGPVWHCSPGVVDSLVSADEVVKSKVAY